MSTQKDVTITIRPAGNNVYTLSPFPFAFSGGEFAFGGRHIAPVHGGGNGGWPAVLRQTPTVWENLRLVAG